MVQTERYPHLQGLLLQIQIVYKYKTNKQKNKSLVPADDMAKVDCTLIAERLGN